MLYPNYKEMTCVAKVVKRDDGDGVSYVPDLPKIFYSLVLKCVDGRNYYSYDLPSTTLGKDCLCHVIYKAEDEVYLTAFVASRGKRLEGNVTSTQEYKAIAKVTVADVKVSEEKSRLVAEAESRGEVASKAVLDSVKYTEADAAQAAPLWVFHSKDYVDS